MWTIAVFSATVFLAYANGANDNFKGVATLFGSQTSNYKVAIWWATATTFAGSLCSVIFASALLKSFSGKGLVPDAIADTESFHLAVAVGAAITVILATVTGFPISTTHGITGALTGAGLAAIGTDLNFAALGKSYFIPLLLSPLIAIALGLSLYSLLHYLRSASKIDKAWCVCVGKQQELVPVGSEHLASQKFGMAIDTVENCQQHYVGSFLGINSQKLVDTAHFLSAGAVSFARGLAANLATGFLVIFASRMGVPVSTTHVSVGSIFGVGVISKTAHLGMFSKVLSSWVLTLPTAAIISALAYFVLPK